MPTVNAEIAVAAPVDRVYQIARDIEKFPEFMDDVESVEILEQTPEKQVSKWGSIIKEFNRTITWTEADYWDDAAKTCRWEQLEGDFTRYEGEWQFVSDGEGSIARLTINYEYTVPLIGALIQGLLLKKMQANVQSMLEAIKARAEQG
ncbi:MAG: SRPBCC family protein [Armatimonadetes bacterium]|nr:SRPBCC family protein [Armatimonadota bacterium]